MVAEHIKELLYLENEVIINDLGSFLTSYESAQIHPATHKFAPPS